MAGYNIEYSSRTFALFFLAEYGSRFALSYMFSAFFLGGGAPLFWLPLPNSLGIARKAVVIAVMFVVVRANFPRYRYDQLMGVGWKLFLPLTFGGFMLTIALLAMFTDGTGLTPIL